MPRKWNRLFRLSSNDKAWDGYSHVVGRPSHARAAGADIARHGEPGPGGCNRDRCERESDTRSQARRLSRASRREAPGTEILRLRAPARTALRGENTDGRCDSARADIEAREASRHAQTRAGAPHDRVVRRRSA